MNKTVSDYPITTPRQLLSTAELHRRLEKCVQDYQRAERLICFYLLQMKRRRGFQELGFANIEDYALELLGFSPSKTRQLLALGRKLLALPRVTEALARGAIGWTKASRSPWWPPPRTKTNGWKRR